ncbi:MAG: ribokinase [Beijerinckiaceae bacterium]
MMKAATRAEDQLSGIVVFGSINIDLVCRAEKIPAPGETILAPSYMCFAGGKGANQAVAAARAGADVIMIGAVGDDAFAELPLSSLRDAGVNVANIRCTSSPTGAAFITVSAEGENAITVASGANRDVEAVWIDQILWPKCSVLLLQGELAWAESIIAAREAWARDKIVILNAAPSGGFDPSILPFVTALIVNDHELQDISAKLGIKSGENADLGRALQKLANCHVIVTRGADGVDVYIRDRAFHIAAMAITPVDTTGAGDTFCGVFAAMQAQGRSLDISASMAATAASLACLAQGAQTSMPDLTEIEKAVSAAVRQKNSI